MNEIPVQTIVFEVNDKIDARELCEILAMNGYMAKAKSDDDSITGGWLVFVEVGYPKHTQTAKSVYGNDSDDARVAELEAELVTAKQKLTDCEERNASLERVLEMDDEENIKLSSRVSELESENDRLQSAWYYYETICPDGSLRPKVSDLLQELDETKAKIAERDKALDDVVHELSRMEIDRDELLKEMQWRLENKNHRIAYLKHRLELAVAEREK